jgi:hypothetical protein
VIPGELFTLTLAVTKAGTASATVGSIDLNPDAVGICTGQDPPTSIPAFTTTSFTWNCASSATGLLSLNATVHWVDANVPGTLRTSTPATPAVVTVQ